MPAAVVLAQFAQQHKPGGLGRLAGQIGRPGVHALPQRIFALGQQPAQHAAFCGLLPSEGFAAAAVLGAHFGIRAPMHVEFGHAAAQEFGIGFVNLPMAAHRLGIEQGQQAFGFESALHQGDELLGQQHQRLAAAEAHVGHGIRQGAAAGRGFAEHGVDEGQVVFHGGGEHGDVVRLQLGLVRQTAQQVFFEDLQLAQGAVGGLDHNAAVHLRAAFFR